MANNDLIVDERQVNLGNFMVGRLLPFRKKRQVGPFTFIDHMGPGIIGNRKYSDVDQHPHIGISTLTYLFEGFIEHRDSIGSIQTIRPGDVGFMTAGKGATHTERTPREFRNGTSFTLHGYQIWVALPKELCFIEPRFDFIEKNDIPKWSKNGLDFKLVAGNGFNRSSPLQGYSPLFMIDIYSQEVNELNLANQLSGEIAFVIVKGSINVEGERVSAGQMLISKTNEHCSISLNEQTQILLFGGAPLPEERFLMWNFVSHDKEILNQAKQDWIDKRFPKVPNDGTYIPFPSKYM